MVIFYDMELPLIGNVSWPEPYQHHGIGKRPAALGGRGLKDMTTERDWHHAEVAKSWKCFEVDPELGNWPFRVHDDDHLT